MRTYVLGRLASLVPLLIGLTVLSFTLGQLAPGDTARSLLRSQGGRPPTDEEVRDFRVKLGLDRPAPVQYGRWVSGAVTGDLGRSFESGQPVAAALRQALPVTLELGLLAFLIVLVVGIGLGVAAALAHGGPVDHAIRLLTLAGASLPTYFFGYLLIIVFSVHLGLLPTAGISSPAGYVLPAVTLAVYPTSVMLRLTRASMLDVLGEDFVRHARARGLPPFRVVFHHALRVALNPVVTYGGLVLGGLLGGAVIVEYVFALPGIGRLVVDAVGNRDIPVVQGFVLVFGAIVVLLSLAVDLLYGVLDPRVRTVEEHLGARHAA